jgi:hypothetical protein
MATSGMAIPARWACCWTRLSSGGALGHQLGYGQRDERAAETDDRREYEQRIEIDPDALFVEDRIDAEQPEDDGEKHQDGDVGRQEQQYPLHALSPDFQ